MHGVWMELVQREKMYRDVNRAAGTGPYGYVLQPFLTSPKRGFMLVPDSGMGFHRDKGSVGGPMRKAVSSLSEPFRGRPQTPIHFLSGFEHA